MTLHDTYPYYLANAPRRSGATLAVHDKFTGKPVTAVAVADEPAIDEAISCAVAAVPAMARLAAFERRAVLEHCVSRFQERRDDFAEVLCVEAGKPIRDSRGEVTRLIDTFRVAAEESTRMVGEVMPLDISERARGYRGMWRRVPIGAVSFITPFNFPLNLVAHKIAPAIAAGCPFVLKPASFTPVGALMIGEILAETSLPAGAFSILPCSRAAAHRLTTDERLKLLSFTGSPEVGWALKAAAGKKKVVLELGGNAAVIIDEDADLEDAVARVVFGAFYQSGQSCVGVQRILLHEAIADRFEARLIAETRALRCGDPRDEEVRIGPLISEREAARLEGWIHAAVAAGGRILCGGGRVGAMLEATLLADVPRELDIVRREAFGPVAVVSRFRDFGDALAEVNDSDFGLQAGVFTRDIFKAHRAWDELEVGAVLIGEVPSWRVDHMPYGGVKDSGLGREGVRFAMEDMTEPRLMVLRAEAGVRR